MTRKSPAVETARLLAEARAWLAEGKLLRAGNAFRKVLEEDPQHAEALAGVDTAVGKLREMAIAAGKKGDARTTHRAYRSAISLQLTPEPLDLYRFGTLLHLFGKRTAALACFRQAAAIEGTRLMPAKAQRGSDPRVLIVGFTGFHGKIGTSGMDFLRVSGLTQYSRLILWDSSYRFFFGGLPGKAKGYAALVKFIRSQIAALAPQRVVVIGCSGNGFPALLYGHAVGADVVHAFSPTVSLDLPIVERIQPTAAVQYRAVILEAMAAVEDRKLLHLPGVLAEGNGKTRYYIHYGRGSRDDNERAHFIAGLPGVHLIEHETKEHPTAELLAKANLLQAVFATDDPAAMPRLS